MKKIFIAVLIISFVFPIVSFADEGVIEKVKEIEKSLTEESLDVLIQTYKGKQTQLQTIKEEMLRLEGAILFAQDIVKKEKQQEEK